MNAGKKKQSPAPESLEERKKLTFEQAEGIVILPSQIERGTISREFRALLWAELYARLDQHRASYGGKAYLGEPWDTILRDVHVYRDHRAIDDYDDYLDDPVSRVKRLIFDGDWSNVLGWLEFVLKHPSCPGDLAAASDSLMRYCRLAYGVFDGVVISPISSEAERANIARAFADLAASEFHGARAHLRNAAQQLTAGQYADSVRESIHAVEAAARVLEPSAALNSALGQLENSAKIHKALKHGFSNLYGYTSDEKGIRHPLLDDGTAKVDETDALFMIGACAAFVSYLINKGRTAGLIK